MRQGIKMNELLRTGACGIALLVASACSGSDNAGPAAEAGRAESMSREERIAMRQKIEEARTISAIPIEETSDDAPAGGVTGEVPDEILDKILADLEERTSADRSEFRILQAEITQWSNGALGCPEPGQVYTHAIVEGYRVVVVHAGQTYDYRANAKGFFKLCEGFRPNRSDNPAM